MKNIFKREGFNFMKSKGRAVLHTETLPKFASFYKNNDIIVNVGTHRFWDYKSYFVNAGLLCEYISTDVKEIMDHITEKNRTDKIDNICASTFEDNSVDGIIFIGMHDNIKDPVTSYKEMYRILKPGGRILIAFPGSGAKCGGQLVDENSWRKFIAEFIVDEVAYVYDPENDQRYADGKNTSIIVIARKSYESTQV